MGNRLRYLRIRLGIHTAKQLSNLLCLQYEYKIGSTTLARIETGDSRPDIDLLFRLCYLYEVDMNTLLDFPAPNTPDQIDGIGKPQIAKLVHRKRQNR